MSTKRYLNQSCPNMINSLFCPRGSFKYENNNLTILDENKILNINESELISFISICRWRRHQNFT